MWSPQSLSLSLSLSLLFLSLTDVGFPSVRAAERKSASLAIRDNGFRSH